MSESRDEIDVQVAAKLRQLRLARPVPAPGDDEPTDEELLRYIDGAASGRERERLEERIARSAYASARVGVVVEALRDAGYPLPKLESVGRRVARYVFRELDGALAFLRGSDMPAALAPALAVRGAAVAEKPSFFEFAHEFDARYAAKLAIERVGGRGLELHVTVTDGGAPLDGARVTLKRGDKTIDSASTEGGACSFADLPAARYLIEVKRAGEALGELHVDVLG